MATTVTRSTGGALIPTSTGLSSQPVNTLTAAQQLAEQRGGQNFNQQVVPTGSNLTAADIAWLSQGKGMYGNPLFYDPTSPIQWALASGIGVPASAFATTAVANALGLTNVSMAAADAAQLASQGLSEAQIANILQTSYNIPSGVASSLAFSAAEGGTPFEIAQFTGDVNFGTPASTGPSVPTAVTSPTTTVPGTVTVTGQPATTTGSSTLSDVVSGGLLTNLINIPAPADTVTITGEPATTSTTTTTPVDAVTSAGTINITGTRIPAPADDYISPVIPPLINPVIPTAPTTIGSTTSTTTKPNIFNPSDILRLLGLAGVTAAGSQAGTGTGTGTVVTPRSDANIGSTTPQFGDEYYSAVQRYYNTFMPQTPRDVAGPLQQWYENRYGAPAGTAPTTPTMISPDAGTGAVSGGRATPSSARTGMMTSAARAPMGAQTVQDFMAAQPTTSPSTGVTTGGIPGTSISAITDQQIFDVGRSLLQQGVNPQTILDRLATVDGVTQDQINTAAQWLQTSGYTGLNVPGSKSTIPTRVTRDTADIGMQTTPTPTADEVRLADQAARSRAIQLGAVKDLTDANPSLKTAIDKILEVSPNYAPNYNDAMVLQYNIKTKGFDKAMLDFFGEKNIPQGVKEFTPAPATQQNWTSKANEYAAKNISPTAALWRDPKSGSGIGVTLDKNGVPSGFTFYDPQGVALYQTAFYADELYRNAEKLGMDLSNIGELGKQLEAKKIGYKPYELYKGTGSDHGIDFNDIARGGLGTAYDWTVDPLAYLKGNTGFTGQKTLQDNINLAADLGLLKYADVTTGLGIDPSRFTPITAGKGESAEQRGFVVYNGKTASWYGSADEAAEAAKNYPGATVYDLSKGTPPGFSAPQTGVSAPGGIETLKADQAVTQRLAQAIKESMAQGFTLEQTKQGAIQKLGVTETQFNAAVKVAGLAPGG